MSSTGRRPPSAALPVQSPLFFDQRQCLARAPAPPRRTATVVEAETLHVNRYGDSDFASLSIPLPNIKDTRSTMPSRPSAPLALPAPPSRPPPPPPPRYHEATTDDRDDPDANSTHDDDGAPAAEDGPGKKAAKAVGIGLAAIVATPFALAGAAVLGAGALVWGAGKVVEGVGRTLVAGPEAAAGAAMGSRGSRQERRGGGSARR
ncbi:hypothetical protein ACG7TL_006632 [Trametes sanguinea]